MEARFMTAAANFYPAGKGNSNDKEEYVEAAKKL
jgi:hypothetical protein